VRAGIRCGGRSPRGWRRGVVPGVVLVGGWSPVVMGWCRGDGGQSGEWLNGGSPQDGARLACSRDVGKRAAGDDRMVRCMMGWAVSRRWGCRSADPRRMGRVVVGQEMVGAMFALAVPAPSAMTAKPKPPARTARVPTFVETTVCGPNGGSSLDIDFIAALRRQRLRAGGLLQPGATLLLRARRRRCRGEYGLAQVGRLQGHRACQPGHQQWWRGNDRDGRQHTISLTSFGFGAISGAGLRLGGGLTTGERRGSHHRHHDRHTQGDIT